MKLVEKCTLLIEFAQNYASASETASYCVAFILALVDICLLGFYGERARWYVSQPAYCGVRQNAESRQKWRVGRFTRAGESGETSAKRKSWYFASSSTVLDFAA